MTHVTVINALLCNKQDGFFFSKNGAFLSTAADNNMHYFIESSSASKQDNSFRVQLPQIIAVIIKNFLVITVGSLYGYVTILIPNLSGNTENENLKLDEEQISWIGSINMLSVSIGCLSTGFLPASLGRKRAMQIFTIPLIISWIIIGFANRIWHLNLALCICGFSGGICKGPIVSYAVEISQPRLRGMLAATTSFLFIFGLIVQYILGSFCEWRTLAFMNCFTPTSAFILLFFVPESPYWLLMNNKFEEAQKSLAWLRGWTTVAKIEDEYKMLRVHCSSSYHSDKKSKICENTNNYFKKSFLWPLALITFIFLMCHLSGVSTLTTYAVKIFENLRVPINKYYAVILLGVANFIGCAINIGFIRYTGKRWMIFVSVICIGISSAIVGTYAYLNNTITFSLNVSSEPSVKFEETYYQWIPLIFLLLITLTSNFGLIPVGIVLIGEIFGKKTRSTGCGIASAILHIIGFGVNKLFFKMIALFTIPGIYWFYSGISLLTFVVLYFALPETEGRTLQEIEDHFSETSKLQKNGLSVEHNKGECNTQENKKLVNLNTIN